MMTIEQKRRLAGALRRYRMQAGLTREEAAKRLRVSGSTISNWEGARTLPTLDTLIAVASVYGVKARDLLAAADL